MKCGESVGSLAALCLCLQLLPFCQSDTSLVMGQALITDQTVVDEMVLLHSFYRGNVTPTAANMHTLVWDDYLADAALNFSVMCTTDFTGHSTIPGFTTVGRSFSNNDPRLGVAELYSGAITTWVSRQKSYNHSGDFCLVTADQCEAYRQIIWAESRAFGCGAALCPPDTIIPYQSTTYLNCFYGPREGERPYIVGPPCTICSENHTDCRENLCTLETNMEPDAIPISNNSSNMNGSNTGDGGGGSGLERNDTDTTDIDDEDFDMSDMDENMRNNLNPTANNGANVLGTELSLLLLHIILMVLTRFNTACAIHFMVA